MLCTGDRKAMSGRYAGMICVRSFRKAGITTGWTRIFRRRRSGRQWLALSAMPKPLIGPPLSTRWLTARRFTACPTPASLLYPVNFKFFARDFNCKTFSSLRYTIYNTKLKKEKIREKIPLTLFRLGFFGVPGPGGGASNPPPLHKSESIDAIAMKLGG